MLNKFKKDIPINAEIPGFKSAEQLKVIGEITQTLKWGATIVELGACAGRGTWTISKCSPPFSKVYAIDLWNQKNVFMGKGYNLNSSDIADLEFFKKHTSNCRNIIPIKGDAGDIPFDKKVDLLMIDCDKGKGRNNYDSIWENWLPKLSPHGIVIGANFFPEYRDDEVSFVEKVRPHFKSFKHREGIWWCQYPAMLADTACHL